MTKGRQNVTKKTTNTDQARKQIKAMPMTRVLAFILREAALNERDKGIVVEVGDMNKDGTFKVRCLDGSEITVVQTAGRRDGKDIRP